MTTRAPVVPGTASSLRPPAPQAQTKNNSPSLLWTVAAALCGLLFVVPWRGESTRAQLGYLDFSWVWALSDGFAHGRVLGRELVFTAGPLGFLGPRAYFPETGSLLWIGWSAIAVLWSSLLWRQLARSVPNPILRVALFAWTVSCAVISSDAFFLAVPILAAAIAFTRANDSAAPVDLLAVSVLLAAGALVKFSFLVAGTATIAILSVWDIARRRPPLAGIAYVVAMLVLWSACGQPFGAIPDFIKTSMQVAGGYTPAMSRTIGDRRAFLGLVATMTVTLAVAAWITLRRRCVGFGVVSIIWLGTWLLAAKASFVRFDEVHEVIAPLWVTSALPILWGTMLTLDAGLGVAVIMVVLLCASWGSTELALRHARRPGLVSNVVGLPMRALRSAGVMVNPRRALRREEQAFDVMRHDELARTPLPQVRGTVDAYPSDVSALLSHGFAYEPRPVLQSYAAYTPRLADLNAAHLRGGKAPENILLDIAPIDNRLASMEDGSSWTEIWRRYSFSADTGGFLWLRRRESLRAVADPPLLSSMTATIGVPFALPDVACGGVMAAFELRPTLWYRLKTLLWKAPELVVHFAPRDRDWRVEPTLLGIPFLISPTIETRKQFAEFMQTGGTTSSNGRPTSAELRVPDARPERYFSPHFTVRFFSVQPVDSCPVSSVQGR